MAKSYFYLGIEEVQHYDYMIQRGYSHKIVEIRGQKYVIFSLMDKPHVGIAWPTLTGRLDGMPIESDTIFEPCMPLQKMIIKSLKMSLIRILLFPRLAD